MRQLNIPAIELPDESRIEKAALYFERNGTYEYIDMLNWPTQYPYKPKCSFKTAHSRTSLYIHFKIIEKNIRAVNTIDQEPVWEDSCVEFFCQHPNQVNYYNFEFNCIGTCLASSREGRSSNIIPFTTTELDQILRHSSLERKRFDEKTGLFEWKLTVKIPFSLIGLESKAFPYALNANFYKCGDATSTPHYLSWNYISTEKPDFHCPKFFGEITLL